MQLPLQVTIRDMPHSNGLEDQIHRKAEKLERIYNHIIACRVVVDLMSKHQHQGKLYNVRIDLSVPGEELSVTKNANEDAYVAVRDSFENAKRKLEEFAERQKGDGKLHQLKLPMQGRIIKIFSDLGYGFIETLDGTEVYFHHSVVKPSLNHLEIGDPVHFLEEMGYKGPQASRVRLMKEDLLS